MANVTNPQEGQTYYPSVPWSEELSGLFYNRNGYFIEDPAAGPWNGLWVHDTTNTPTLGDRLRLAGTV